MKSPRIPLQLLAKDGRVWMNQNQLAELFDTSVTNLRMHVSNVLEESELDAKSAIKNYLTTATDGKNYEVTFYSLDMILAIGFRIASILTAVTNPHRIPRLFSIDG